MGACGCVDSVESRQMGWVQRYVSVALGLAVVTAGVGCGLMRRRPGASDGSVGRDMREGRRPMGQVTMVDTERGFVLVRSPLAAQVAAESRLVIRAGEEAGSTAQLKVSPERKRNMIAADILEGVPVVGAVVFFPTTEKVVSTEPPRLEAYGVGAADLGGGGSGGAVAGGSGADGSLADDELPPLGEPSGPVEQVPDFPDLELPGELPQ